MEQEKDPVKFETIYFILFPVLAVPSLHHHRQVDLKKLLLYLHILGHTHSNQTIKDT